MRRLADWLELDMLGEIRPRDWIAGILLAVTLSIRF